MSTVDPFAIETEEDQLAADLVDAPESLVEKLVALRTQRRISTRTLAERMNRHPSQVSRFEAMDSDLRMSTILRYAYAVGARIDFDVKPARVHGYEDWDEVRPVDSAHEAEIITFPTSVQDEFHTVCAV